MFLFSSLPTYKALSENDSPTRHTHTQNTYAHIDIVICHLHLVYGLLKAQSLSHTLFTWSDSALSLSICVCVCVCGMGRGVLGCRNAWRRSTVWIIVISALLAASGQTLIFQHMSSSEVWTELALRNDPLNVCEKKVSLLGGGWQGERRTLGNSLYLSLAGHGLVWFQGVLYWIWL